MQRLFGGSSDDGGGRSGRRCTAGSDRDRRRGEDETNPRGGGGGNGNNGNGNNATPTADGSCCTSSIDSEPQRRCERSSSPPPPPPSFLSRFRPSRNRSNDSGYSNKETITSTTREEQEYLDGLRTSAASTPPPLPSSSAKDDGSCNSSEEDEKDDDDDELVRRISVVEHDLLDLVDHSVELRLDDDDGDGEQRPGAAAAQKRAKLPATVPIPREDLPSLLLPVHGEHAYPCPHTYRRLPGPPSAWPQAPIMIRPTPGSRTRIRGIRYASSSSSVGTAGGYRHFSGFCAGCVLPINNGRERPGRSLVVDFETPLFVGTMQVRIRDAPPAAVDDREEGGASHDDPSASYFDGKKRRYQVVVTGRFTKPVPVGECVTGQAFDRPAGALPARWVVHAFVRFISSLAPQLEASFGDEPRFLTPLATTAHTVVTKTIREPHQPPAPPPSNVAWEENDDDHDDRSSKAASYMYYPGSTETEREIYEPELDDPSNLLSELPTDLFPASERVGGKSVSARVKTRKRVFGNLITNSTTAAMTTAAADPAVPCFSTEKEYTFEFYQHLLLMTDPDDIKIDAVHATIGLSKALDGQPIKIMAAHRVPKSSPSPNNPSGADYELDPLWSFDLWHEALYPYAQSALDEDTDEEGPA